jgi:hypothetical protein
MNLTAVRKPAVERRPVVRNVVQRSAAAVATPTPARALQDRVGSRAVQAVVAPSIQTAAIAARVSKPTDAAEMEAEAVARHVARMAHPAPAASAGTTPRQVSKSEVQREAATPPRKSTTSVGGGGGTPLPPPVRDFMEPRFGANFDHVRIHTGTDAAHQSAQLGANAFTYGNNVFFGKDKFQPQTAKGKELIAHELTHTIQQGVASQKGTVHRSAMVSASEAPMVQRDFLGIPNPREYFANKAENIPGFTMLTVVIGYNPITNARVARTAGNILKGAIQMIPGGKFISDALDSHGIFDQVSQWVNQQFEALKDIGAAIWQSIEDFIKGFKLSDLTDLGGLWERAKALVTAPIERIKNFAISVKDGIVKLIKDAILKPIAAYAATTRGYPLLRTIMGKDPITGETVVQDAESLLGAFLTFIGEDELWATMQKAKAVPRAFAWFKAAKAALMGFISEIPGLFVQAFRSLEVIDIILIPRAFLKLASVFGNFAVRFVTWGAQAVWNLLEIIFDVVSPGALEYIKKTGAALKSILKNPLPFVGNLVKAAKLGFSNFGSNLLEHLKAGLIDWLTGSLPGIYIPKAFSLMEIAKFAFSVLGLTWANIRQKLVKATSETVVKALETGFDIVVTLVRDGPGAAWDKIKEQLANLKDMVIGGITDFVVDMVVKKAIPKLIAMFIPGAGFISAILSIYDTVMVFVNKIKQIIQVVAGFIDSLVAIAAGNIGAAADRVEKALAGVLSLAINFLAGFAGLGKVADQVMGVINKIRAPIDKALDWLVNWIVTAAKRLGKAVVQAGVPEDPNERFKQGMEKAEKAINAFAGKPVGKIVLTPLLAAIKVRYGFTVLDVVQSGKQWAIEGALNPKETRPTRVLVADPSAGGGAMPLMTVLFGVKPSIYNAKDEKEISLWDHYVQQLQLQENKLRTLIIKTWLTNITEFYGDKGKGIAAKGRSAEGDRIAREIRARLVAKKTIQLMTQDKTLSNDAAKAKAAEFYSKQAVLHLLDQGGGGAGTEFVGDLLKAAELEVQAKDEGYLGNARVDYSIGASWPARAKELKGNIEQKVDSSALPTEKMNVKLEAKKQ